MAYDRYSELPPSRTGPYWTINVGSKYDEIEQERIGNTVSIILVNTVAKEKRRTIEITSDSQTKADNNPVQKASIEEEKSLQAVMKITEHEDRLTGT